MPKRILVEHARDFTGGWNLATGAYDLAENEFPHVLNVDPGRRGGFAIRRGSRPFYSPLSAIDIDTTHTYVTSADVRHQLIAGGTGTNPTSAIYRWDGAAWQLVHAGYNNVGARTIFVEMNDALYIVKSPDFAVRKWTGTGLATEIPAPAFHDDLAAPTGNTFIRGRAAAVHNGVMFVGNLLDPIDAAYHRCRIRWSHPNRPEDWRTNDWIDIDPDDDAGVITALVPFGDRLLVFKNRAIYAVSGYPPEGFSVTAITRAVGAPGDAAITSTEGMVYFWDVAKGLCSFDGRVVAWPFERIFPLIDEAKLDMPFSWFTSVAFHNQKVWIATQYAASPFTGGRIGLVFSPDVGKHGAWTFHTTSLWSLDVIRISTGGDDKLVGGGKHVNTIRYLMELDVENYFEDVTNGGTLASSRIDAQLQTRWFDAKNPAQKKRWKRPIAVVGADANQEIKVDVFDDYNPSIVRRTFSLFTDVNGTEGVWDVSDWDEVVWASEIADRAYILKGSPLGTGTAKALRFSNVSKGTDWRVHGVSMKWIPKIIRN